MSDTKKTKKTTKAKKDGRSESSKNNIKKAQTAKSEMQRAKKKEVDAFVKQVNAKYAKKKQYVSESDDENNDIQEESKKESKKECAKIVDNTLPAKSPKLKKTKKKKVVIEESDESSSDEEIIIKSRKQPKKNHDSMEKMLSEIKLQQENALKEIYSKLNDRPKSDNIPQQPIINIHSPAPISVENKPTELQKNLKNSLLRWD